MDSASEIAPFNTSVRHTPERVVLARSAQDVVEAVRLAQRDGLRVHVQGAGHGAAAPIQSGLLISTRRLDGFAFDASRTVAVLQAGARWGPLIDLAARHGLAPVAGSSPSVGVVGYLLGGGLGPFIRSHGFSSDYVESLEVVTGDGEQVRASVTHHPDLFWALRGGKHGLGIVTQVQLRLVRMPSLYAGSLVFDTADIERAFRGWVRSLSSADARVSTSAAIVQYPELDALPTALRGKRLLVLRFAFPGPISEGEQLAAALRAVAPVYVDQLGELALSDVAQIHQDPQDPGPSWVAGALLSHADDGLASAFLAQVGPGTHGPIVAAELRHLGGAAAHDVEGGSAVSGRTAQLALGFLAVDPQTFGDAMPQAAERFFEAIAPWRSAEGNPNLVANGGRAAWLPDVAQRLERVRRTYDPRGMFATGDL